MCFTMFEFSKFSNENLVYEENFARFSNENFPTLFFQIFFSFSFPWIHLLTFAEFLYCFVSDKKREKK